MVDIHLSALQFSKFPARFTFASLNNCWLYSYGLLWTYIKVICVRDALKRKIINTVFQVYDQAVISTAEGPLCEHSLAGIKADSH